MNENNSEQNSLIGKPASGLLNVPPHHTPALCEIIDRSLVHIQTSKRLSAPEWRAGEEQEFEIAPDVWIVMCWIPPGKFLMGSLEDEVSLDEETQHLVTITNGYWLGKYQVTQAQWEAVMGNNQSYFNDSDLPIEVTWSEISETGGFIEEINRFSAAGEIYSLPTEAQWEYGCRAGTVTTLNNGKSLTTAKGVCPNLDKVAWYGGNSGFNTHPVGQKNANAWGLHDMHGNVWEWCVDWSGDFSDEPVVDPRGPDSGSYRIIRGGHAYCNAGECGVAFRSHSDPAYIRHGFRIVRKAVSIITTDSNKRGDAEELKRGPEFQTSKTLGRLHRIGEHDLQWPDYQLVCFWAEQLSILPVEVLMILLDHSASENTVKTKIVNGHFINLVADSRLSGIMGFPKINGLRIRDLIINKLGLRDLDLSLLPKLNLLSCEHNQLSDLDLLPVPNLKMLICSKNKLTRLDLSPVPMLEWVVCALNKLTELDLPQAPNLESLCCAGNFLTNLDLSSVSNIRDLDCSVNEITELDLTPSPNLTSLNCTGNPLIDLDLSPVPNLTELKCSYNQYIGLDMSISRKLKRLECDFIRII